MRTPKPRHDPEAQPRFDDDPPPQRKAKRKAQPPAKPRRGGFKAAMSRPPERQQGETPEELESRKANNAARARAIIDNNA